jgi:hypothetical protein
VETDRLAPSTFECRLEGLAVAPPVDALTLWASPAALSGLAHQESAA